jgi:hypothetical protein
MKSHLTSAVIESSDTKMFTVKIPEKSDATKRKEWRSSVCVGSYSED